MTDTQGFAVLPPRQKMAVLLISGAIGLYLSQAIAAAVPPPKPAVQANPATAPAVTQPVAPSPVPTKAAQQSRPQAQLTPPASIVLTQQEQVQSKYISALNELQMLKIQKEIAETSQAIVAAKLATVAAEKSITDLLSETEISKNPKPLPAPVLSSEAGSYSVQSVSMEQDQWHALVKFKDKLYNVSVGDMLPPDKSVVKSIDQKGVILDTGGMEQRVPLTVTDSASTPSSSTDLPATPPPGVH